jgi:N-acetylmuramoyl-L-alanine amidase
MTVRGVSWAFLTVLFAAAGLAAGQSLAAQSAAPAANPPGAPTADSYPVVTGVRLGGDATQTRFIMDLSRKIEVRAFTLADPYRVIVDIPQVTFELPPKSGEIGRGLIKAFRFGLVMQGGSRIVLDVVKPVRVEQAYVMDAAAGAPARLVLDLVTTDRESFLRRMALDDKRLRTEALRPELRADSGDPRPLVVLDPGHGGLDTGTHASTGELEKDIVLAFAKRLRAWIEKSGKYRVLMTRDDDTYIPLAGRVHMARVAGAALFVSIHADALPHGEGDAQGATVYTLSDKASDPEAAQLAENENRADVIAGIDLKSEPDDVAGILIDLAERETKAFSLQFAHRLLGEMKGVARLHKSPLKAAGFRVLRAPDVPSVLVELGYVSNKQDLQLLLSDAWRERTANSIAKAIEAYLATHVAATRTGAN